MDRIECVARVLAERRVRDNLRYEVAMRAVPRRLNADMDRAVEHAWRDFVRDAEAVVKALDTLER